MLKYNPKFILLFFTAIITNCAPPQSFYKMDGTLNLRNKINKIVEESEIDLNMGIQITSLKNDKIPPNKIAVIMPFITTLPLKTFSKILFSSSSRPSNIFFLE